MDKIASIAMINKKEKLVVTSTIKVVRIAVIHSDN